jgi:inosine/xanthosine triphosphate pyrophosphatase family protein/diadenosine tetraphosphate (Ap4A) HIT family hydrolase
VLTLVTSNPAKYAPFASEMKRLGLTLEALPRPLPEIQSLNFSETLTAKARAAAAMFGRPVLVDDTGLVLDAYPSFPGPLTSVVLRSLGSVGLGRLLTGPSDRAVMECHLGCWLNGSLQSWTGRVSGRIDLSHPHPDQRMPLTDLFVPDPGPEGAVLAQASLPHRARALAALEADIFALHLQTAPPGTGEAGACASRSHTAYDCPFCAEIEGDNLNTFAAIMGSRLSSRVVYEDEHFLVLPPLGEFMEGGLLLLTREHILSLAHLPPARFNHLEKLLQAIQNALRKRWGVRPVIFEHGPAPEWGKGLCCVDHAHLNIFPAAVEVHSHLGDRMHLAIDSLSELTKLRRAEFGYLFVQENNGVRHAYDGRDVPTQLVRRILTAQLGYPERWHWRDYLGEKELMATCQALKDQISL